MPPHSLLIGVQSYERAANLTPLTCPHADVDLMAGILSDARYVGEGATVRTLKDPGWAEAQEAILDFVDRVDRDDTVTIYYSGHGMKAAENDLVLCMRDTRDTNPHLENTGIEFLRLKRTLRARGLRRVLVLLDCCYSGAASAKDSVQSTLNAAEEVLDNGEGFYVLSSSSQTQRSHEAGGHSVFTRYLADGITSGDADTNNDGLITVQELSDFVCRRVPEETPLQTPQMSSHAALGSGLIANR